MFELELAGSICGVPGCWAPACTWEGPCTSCIGLVSWYRLVHVVRTYLLRCEPLGGHGCVRKMDRNERTVCESEVKAVGRTQSSLVIAPADVDGVCEQVEGV